MRKFWIIFSSLFTICNYAKAQDATGRNLYSPRYDNLDIDTILASNRLVTNYVECLLNRKPCPPEGKDLKRILPEALRTKCGRCTPRQKENALKVITKLYQKYPQHYKALVDRWDPTGEYNRRFEEYLQDSQFNQINNSDRPVRNDFDRDQSQINVQKIPLNSPNAIVTEQPRTTSTTTTSTTTSTTERRVQETMERAQNNTKITQLKPLLEAQRPALPQRQSQVVPSAQNFIQINTKLEMMTTKMPPTVPTFGTTRLILRPVNQNFNEMRPINQNTQSFVIKNRFNDVADEEVSSTSSRITQRPTVTRQITRPVTSATPSRATSRYTVANNIIDNFFIPPSESTYSLPTASPFVGFINQIGTKIQNSAAFIAGMLRTTVNVIVGAHQAKVNA